MSTREQCVYWRHWSGVTTGDTEVVTDSVIMPTFLFTSACVDLMAACSQLNTTDNKDILIYICLESIINCPMY